LKAAIKNIVLKSSVEDQVKEGKERGSVEEKNAQMPCVKFNVGRKKS